MVDLTGKHILVTGATNGIGEVSALELARTGASVTVVSRSEDKCRHTVESIQQKTGNPNIDYLVADLSSIDDIRDLATRIRQKYDRLDVLLNNAGAVFDTRKESVDGLEMTFALNHIGYFLLTNELLPLIKQTADANPDWGARIVNVSSEAHRTDMNWDDVQYENGYNAMGAYGQSKCMNVLFTYELADQLEGSGITVNALHPGFVSTGFGKNNNWFYKAILTVLSPFAKSSDEGAETSIYLASSPDVAGVTGKYFADKKQKDTIQETHSEENQRRLWELSERVVRQEYAPAEMTHREPVTA